MVDGEALIAHAAKFTADRPQDASQDATFPGFPSWRVARDVLLRGQVADRARWLFAIEERAAKPALKPCDQVMRNAGRAILAIGTAYRFSPPAQHRAQQLLADGLNRLGEKQPRRQHQRSSSSIGHPESKHEIASVWSYRHRCHDRDTGNGANDDPHLQYHEHAGSRRRGEHTDIIS